MTGLTIEMAKNGKNLSGRCFGSRGCGHGIKIAGAGSGGAKISENRYKQLPFEEIVQ